MKRMETLVSILEALLFAAGDPVTLEEIQRGHPIAERRTGRSRAATPRERLRRNATAYRLCKWPVATAW